MPTIGEVIANELKKAGADLTSPVFKDIVGIGIEAPQEAVDALNKLITVDTAKNSSELKKHFTHSILDPLDKEASAFLDTLGLDDADKATLLSETSTYKKIPAILKKTQEIADLKAKAAGGNKGSEEAQKKIDALNEEVKSLKASFEQKLTQITGEHHSKLENFVWDSVLKNYEYANDKVEKGTSAKIAKTVIAEELAKSGAVSVYNAETNQFELKDAKDTSLKYQVDHKDVTFNEFVEGTLARYGLLKQSGAATPATPITPKVIQADQKLAVVAKAKQHLQSL